MRLENMLKRMSIMQFKDIKKLLKWDVKKPENYSKKNRFLCCMMIQAIMIKKLVLY